MGKRKILGNILTCKTCIEMKPVSDDESRKFRLEVLEVVKEISHTEGYVPWPWLKHHDVPYKFGAVGE